jgi:hypothetical protein
LVITATLEIQGGLDAGKASGLFLPVVNTGTLQSVPGSPLSRLMVDRRRQTNFFIFTERKTDGL